MYKGFLISVAESRTRNGKNKVTLMEANIPKELEAVCNKEQAMGGRLWKIEAEAGSEAWSEMWSRLMTVRGVERANMIVAIVNEVDKEERMIVLAEGPTKKGERELWNIMTRHEKARWIKKQYPLMQETVGVIWTAEELMEKVAGLAETGIYTMEI